MKKYIWMITLVGFLVKKSLLLAHCQMPCGVYHDDMVFSQIDQYIETMYKGATIINESKFATPKDRNETIRWVLLKDTSTDEVANMITYYFLQQKIKPGEPETSKKLASAHRLLFLLVAIKQNTDRQMVMNFADEWEKFKSMFHIEGYACELEKQKKHREHSEQQLIQEKP